MTNKYRFRLLLILIVFSSILTSHLLNFNNNTSYDQKKIENYLLATNSNLQDYDISRKEIAQFTCDFCQYTVNQFNKLIKYYPERYDKLSDKLLQYRATQSQIYEVSDEQLMKNAIYSVSYLEQLFKLTKEIGVDKYIAEDYTKIEKSD